MWEFLAFLSARDPSQSLVERPLGTCASQKVWDSITLLCEPDASGSLEQGDLSGGNQSAAYVWYLFQFLQEGTHALK